MERDTLAASSADVGAHSARGTGSGGGQSQSQQSTVLIPFPVYMSGGLDGVGVGGMNNLAALNMNMNMMPLTSQFGMGVGMGNLGMGPVSVGAFPLMATAGSPTSASSSHSSGGSSSGGGGAGNGIGSPQMMGLAQSQMQAHHPTHQQLLANFQAELEPSALLQQLDPSNASQLSLHTLTRTSSNQLNAAMPKLHELGMVDVKPFSYVNAQRNSALYNASVSQANSQVVGGLGGAQAQALAQRLYSAPNEGGGVGEQQLRAQYALTSPSPTPSFDLKRSSSLNLAERAADYERRNSATSSCSQGTNGGGAGNGHAGHLNQPTQPTLCSICGDRATGKCRRIHSAYELIKFA